jgi:hypothetical protein
MTATFDRTAQTRFAVIKQADAVPYDPAICLGAAATIQRSGSHLNEPRKSSNQRANKYLAEVCW